MLSARSLLTSIAAIGLLAAGCSSPAVSSNPKLVDPTATRGASGQTDDIYEATQFVIQSLNTSPRVRQQKGNRVVLNKIEDKTGIAGYDAKVLYNKFLSSLTNTSDKLVFLDRASAAGERALQQSGQVKTSGIDTPTGADMVLDIELLQVPSAHTKTIQYTFRLTNLVGEIVWQDSKEIVKKT